MFRICAILLALFLGAWTRGDGSSVVCNVVTGVATGVGAGTCASTPATCNNTGDDVPAFNTFNTWALSWQASHTGRIQLYIPSGSVCRFATSPNSSFGTGISNLLVSGYGATFNDASGAGTVRLGALQGQYFDATHSARLSSVTAGSSSVTLLTPAQASLFTVGQYALITGYDLQGLWAAPAGAPSNPHYFEYVIVSNIVGAVVTFSAPLANTYLSTWPNMNSGSGTSGAADPGGPATLYAIDPGWNIVHEYRGLTFSVAVNQIYAKGRNVTFRDVSYTGTGCSIPTESMRWQMLNSTMTNCNIEIDKLVKDAVFTDVTINQIGNQSSSVDTLTLTRVTAALLLGTPKSATINNSTIAVFRPGAYAYGRSNEVICNTCVINSFDPNNTTGLLDKGPSDNGYDQPGLGMVMSSGKITIPNTLFTTVNWSRWAVPGTNVFWSNSSGWADRLFQVTAVTQDATNTYIQTSESGGFPTPADGGGKLFVRPHPAPKFTCNSCSGTDGVAASLNGATAASPLYSYHQYTYTGAMGVGAGNAQIQWGNLTSFNINVTNAYVGAVGTLNFSPGNTWVTESASFAQTAPLYNPTVNAKTAGVRNVTLSAVTGTQSGDSALTVPDSSRTWFASKAAFGNAFFSADVSAACPGVNCPSITVTTQTNQGVVIPP